VSGTTAPDLSTQDGRDRVIDDDHSANTAMCRHSPIARHWPAEHASVLGPIFESYARAGNLRRFVS